MTSVCLYFQVHQPFRLKWFWPDPLYKHEGPLHELYFDNPLNEFTLKKVAGKCYHPANDIILSHVDHFKSEKRKFKASFSLSGVFLEQCERWDKDLLEKFKQMAQSGCVEFLCETYPHSLTGLYEDKEIFRRDVAEQKQALKDYLGYKPEVFRNTELLFNNDISYEAEKMGFKAIIT